MKKNRKAKAPAYPSVKTQWAYWMQAIEPKSEAINKAFPGYQPQWLQRSQRGTVNAEGFVYLRMFVLNLSQAKTAAYLRVSTKQVRAWETGAEPVPFMAFELLRMVCESAAHRLSHAKWDGWFIGEDGGFVSPDVGRLSVKPEDFTAWQYTQSELETHRANVKKMQEEITALVAENTRLRGLFVNQGVVDEIAYIRDRMGELFGQINTARIFELKSDRKAA
jgi:hypothetical protein